MAEPMSRKALIAILAGLWALALASSAAAQSVTRGPYLQSGTPTGVVVRWRTDFATDSRVMYGPAAGNLSDQVDDSTTTTEHEVRLTGLSPETTYYYAI
ncbi:MAG: metallophosphoesterase, partial [Lysobacterales bacterium]